MTAIDKVFIREDSPDWGNRYPVGPVHFRIRCRQCDWQIDDYPPSRIDDSEQKAIEHWFETHFGA